MTREEEIKYASKDYVNYLLDKQEYHNEKYTEYDIKQAFEKGAEWANNHSINVWHIAIVILLLVMNERIYNINKKLRNIQTKIDDIGFTCNDIESQNEDIYTELNLLSLMLNNIRDSKNSFYINNNEPRSEK